MVFGLDKNLMVKKKKKKTSCFISDVVKASRLRATTFLKEKTGKSRQKKLRKVFHLDERTLLHFSPKERLRWGAY